MPTNPQDNPQGPTQQQMINQREALDAMVLLEESRRRKQAEIMLEQASQTIQILTAEIEALKAKAEPKPKKDKKA